MHIIKMLGSESNNLRLRDVHTVDLSNTEDKTVFAMSKQKLYLPGEKEKEQNRTVTFYNRDYVDQADKKCNMKNI